MTPKEGMAEKEEIITGGGTGTVYHICVECEQLKEALGYYADVSNYNETTDYACFSHEAIPSGQTYVDEDGGSIARKALL